MKKSKYLIPAVLIVTFLFLWNCSLFHKSSDEIQTSPASAPTGDLIPPQTESEENVQTVMEEKDQKSEDSLPEEGAPVEEKADPFVMLEEALDAYQDSRLAWEKGDFDTALQALDEAYSLLLKLDLPSDSSLIQQKNELRLLIAQRIQEIYASQLTTVWNNHQTIPIVENESIENVKYEIKEFQTRERKLFEEAYKRSGRYQQMIVEELRKAGLPEELSWMPLIESWFKVKAYSRAAALGLWQFIASTGYRFGLNRDRFIDERMDPRKSTQAAAKYLNELHSHFGDWTTALAAYNCGEFKVKRILRTQRPNYLDNFWDLHRILPKETARFVPRFIATLLIIRNPEKYGFNLPNPDPPLQFETISMNSPVKISALSEALGLKEEELNSLNPELRRQSTPNYEYTLKIPPGYRERVLIALNSLPTWIPPETTYVLHYVRRGDTLSGIARRYRTSISSIARLNRLRRINLITPGQRLRIPTRATRINVSPRPVRKLIKEGKKPIYVVRRGDSLYKIANSFKTTVEKIKRDNNIQSDILNVGQKLVIQTEKPEGATAYTVKSGDTPLEIARKYGMDLTTLLDINGLSYRSKIYPGQELWIISKNSK